MWALSCLSAVTRFTAFSLYHTSMMSSNHPIDGACSLSAGSHPYVDYLKTLEFGGREGNYFDLPGLGGDKYGEWHLCMVECSLSLCLDFDILLGLGIFN